jgi:hypothetical protein
MVENRSGSVCVLEIRFLHGRGASEADAVVRRLGYGGES